ncbi:hypothetical protein B0T19DRAFT_409841 [Cercophora scortea]|uniref:Yeast cell wall synthesis Kre9/Knh1-like N-terminal domain-containing protein n=1 Tax=Cercophora scortea TaxID=314031 RepID=A0AAE0MLZ0_9PEZI|nr:hypothetical protein B0T19DRAFT_409841 [Cercophora scortea]
MKLVPPALPVSRVWVPSPLAGPTTTSTSTGRSQLLPSSLLFPSFLSLHSTNPRSIDPHCRFFIIIDLLHNRFCRLLSHHSPHPAAAVNKTASYNQTNRTFHHCSIIVLDYLSLAQTPHTLFKMKFSLAAIVGAFAAVTLAKPLFTNSVFVVQEGTPFTLTWENATAPVTLSLMEATDRNNLKLVENIATAIPATPGSFTWTPSGIPSGAYAFRITDGPDLTTDANYSVAFQYFSKLLSSSTSATATTGSTSSTITSAASSVTSSASNTTTTTSTSKDLS